MHSQQLPTWESTIKERADFLFRLKLWQRWFQQLWEWRRRWGGGGCNWRPKWWVTPWIIRASDPQETKKRKRRVDEEEDKWRVQRRGQQWGGSTIVSNSSRTKKGQTEDLGHSESFQLLMGPFMFVFVFCILSPGFVLRLQVDFLSWREPHSTSMMLFLHFCIHQLCAIDCLSFGRAHTWGQEPVPEMATVLPSLLESLWPMVLFVDWSIWMI